MRALPILVLASIVLAGCSGLADDRNPTATVTPAPVPASAAPGPYPPGIDASGVVSPTALVRGHVAALSGTSFTATRLEIRRDADGAVRERYERTVRVSPDGRRVRYVLSATDADAAPRNRTVDRWRDGARTYQAVTVGGVRTVTRTEGAVGFADNGTGRRGLARLFSLLDTRLAGETADDGGRTYRLAAGPNASVPPSLSNVSFVALVDRNGLVRAYDLSYVVEFEGEFVRIEVRVRFSDVGETSVGRPSWIPARAR